MELFANIMYRSVGLHGRVVHALLLNPQIFLSILREVKRNVPPVCW